MQLGSDCFSSWSLHPFNYFKKFMVWCFTHIDEHNFLSDKQHAFRKWRSFKTQLTTAINDSAKILNNQGQADTFILAFDTPST